MTLSWHEKAARVAASNPHWNWSQVCAYLAKLPRRDNKPVPAGKVVARMPYKD